MNESRSLFPCKVFGGEHKNSVAFLDAWNIFSLSQRELAISVTASPLCSLSKQSVCATDSSSNCVCHADCHWLCCVFLSNWELRGLNVVKLFIHRLILNTFVHMYVIHYRKWRWFNTSVCYRATCVSRTFCNRIIQITHVTVQPLKECFVNPCVNGWKCFQYSLLCINSDFQPSATSVHKVNILLLLSSSFDWQWKWWESSCRAVCPLFSLCLPGPKESGWVPSQWTQQGWRWCKMWRWQRKRSRGLLF